MSFKLSDEQLAEVSKTIRVISAEAVERANSGHPGMPMGMAEIAAVLWLKHLKFNPQDPNWLARDRFVLSNGHGSMLIYSMLHLSGYDLSLEDIKNFRKLGSKTPGHPESFITSGVECTTGPLGQGIANAVGMALGQKVLEARYATSEHNPVDHLVYCFVGDGCLMEGVSYEAASLAGHLGLGNLIVIFDDNQISIAGRTSLAFSENVRGRFEACGWQVLEADGHDFASIDEAINRAKSETLRPTLIAARTIIGKGSPNKADSAGVHGSPLGASELGLTKKELGWNHEAFFVSEEVKATFAKRQEELKEVYGAWKNDFANWQAKNRAKDAELKKQVELAIPADLQAKLIVALCKDSKAISTRKLSQMALQVIANEVPALIGGSADLEPSTLTVINDSKSIASGSYSGKNIHFGIREHGMGAVMNGLAYYGSFLPFGSTFLVFSDYMRPAIRLAALSELRSLFIYTHDSIFLGEDGPTHQPVEHLSTLRLIPNLNVLRPADALETAVCYALAVERKDGPSLLSFTRQNVEALERSENFDPAQIRKGGYCVFETSKDPEIVFVATGSEVALAVQVAKSLSKTVRVVSLPCVEVFRAQGAAYRESLIPAAAKKVVIEAAATPLWYEIVNGKKEDTLIIGIDTFGASAPQEQLEEHFGFTASAITARLQ